MNAKTTSAFLAALVAVPMWAGGAAAQGQDPIAMRLTACGTTNCGSVKIPGRLNGLGSLTNPWVMSFQAGSGECLRLEITGQTVDLSMAVIGPDGSYYFSEDARRACINCPRVVVNGVNGGAYTVVLSKSQGLPTEATFTLFAGRYPAGNVNCNPPTLPQ